MALPLNLMVTAKRAPKAQKQKIAVLNRIVINRNLHICLECKANGIAFLKRGKASFAVSVKENYPHLANCSQKGKF